MRPRKTHSRWRTSNLLSWATREQYLRASFDPFCSVNNEYILHCYWIATLWERARLIRREFSAFYLKKFEDSFAQIYFTQRCWTLLHIVDEIDTALLNFQTRDEAGKTSFSSITLLLPFTFPLPHPVDKRTLERRSSLDPETRTTCSKLNDWDST